VRVGKVDWDRERGSKGTQRQGLGTKGLRD
jgi:hypothetical protein